VLDEAGRPLGWRPRYTAAHAPPIASLTPIGLDATARNVLEETLASPAGTAVHVDADGRAIGLSGLSDLAGLGAGLDASLGGEGGEGGEGGGA
jgi:hypothetical protein